MAQTFADRLKMAMEKAGIATYKELAEIVGVDPNTVTNWVNKGEIARSSARIVVADALRVNINWLHSGQGKMDLGPEPMRRIREMRQRAENEGRNLDAAEQRLRVLQGQHATFMAAIAAATNNDSKRMLEAELPLIEKKIKELLELTSAYKTTFDTELSAAESSVPYSSGDTDDPERTRDLLRWMFTQKDHAALVQKNWDQVAEQFKNRPPVDVDAFHRNWLQFRLFNILKDRNQELGDAKKAAVLKAAWEDGHGFGHSPDDDQLNRYIDVALA